MKNESAKKLLDFMKKSPTRYQVVANFEAMLDENSKSLRIQGTEILVDKIYQIDFIRATL